MAGSWWNAVIDRFSGHGAFSPIPVNGVERQLAIQSPLG
jgi:hypothetical protein